MNVLIVVAHPDDEILGCGGTAAQLSARGATVTSCILVGDAEARIRRPQTSELQADIRDAQKLIGMQDPILGSFPNIQLNTVPHLDLVRFSEAAIRNTEPDLIFMHHPGDVNNDHLHASLACQAAARLSQRDPNVKPVRGVYFMEVLSSTEWSYRDNRERFAPDAFFEIGAEGLRTKLEALAAYGGVMRPFPHPRSEEVVRGLAAFRGGQSGMRQAEAFQTAFQDLGAWLD